MKLHWGWRLAIFAMLSSMVCTIGFIMLTLSPSDREKSFHACTEMGCDSVIRVKLLGDIPAEYTVDVVGNDGKSWNTVCRTENGHKVGDGCWDSELAIPGTNFGPKELTFMIRWDGGSITQTFTPDYEIWYVNGPDCPPVCYSAELVMRLS